MLSNISFQHNASVERAGTVYLLLFSRLRNGRYKCIGSFAEQFMEPFRYYRACKEPLLLINYCELRVGAAGSERRHKR